MGNRSDIGSAVSGASINPVAQYAAFFKSYSDSSRRSIQATWRALTKACADAGVESWPLTDAAIDAIVRRWIKRGMSASTLPIHRWALQLIQEAAAPDVKLAALSSEPWARLVWSASRTRCPLSSASTITVYETGLLISHLGMDLESQRLGVLLQLLDTTTASLSALLRTKRGDIVGNTIMLSRIPGQNKLNLDADVMTSLLPWLDGVDPQAFLFSNDAGETPLPAQVVSAQLRHCAIEILGHPVTWRAVRNASLRFQLRLGISVQALAKPCGMGAKSLLRVAGLQLSHYEYGLMRDYSTPILSRWPLFTDVYQTMRSANEPFDGVRDRAILSLLFFAFATPQMISAMGRDDFAEGAYCLKRKHGWVMYGNQDRVVASLAAWVSARGEYAGPLFVIRGEQAARHMTTAQIESMVQQRSRRQRRCLTARSVRMAGIRRAADAGLPLAVLADASDLTYKQLADVLNLHQSEETAARVRLQLDALLGARLAPDRLEQVRDEQFRRDYVHSGTP